MEVNFTDEDKQLLQSSINSRICRLKIEIGKLTRKRRREEISRKNWESERKSLKSNIEKLREIKRKLDCYEGCSQQRGKYGCTVEH